MRFFRSTPRFLAAPLAVVFFLTSIPIAPVSAALVSTEEVLAGESAGNKRARVTTFFERQDVRGQLEALGVDPNEAASRVAALSDAEINNIAGRLDRLPAGQSAFGAAVVAAVALFLLLIVTDILGYTDLFPFVKAQPKLKPQPSR